MGRHRESIWVFVLTLTLAGCASGKLEDVDEEEDSSDIGQVLDQDDPSGSDQGMGGDMRDPRTPEMGYVLEDCDLLAQNCADRNGQAQKCVPDAMGEGVCLALGTEKRVGESCSGLHECEVGAICIARGEDSTRCERMCDHMTSSGCLEGEECGDALSTNPTIGLCEGYTPLCDLYDQDCDGEKDCVLLTNPATMTIEPRCGTAGEQGPGQECSTDQTCRAGLLCVRPPEQDGAICVVACQSAPQDTCIGSASCTGETTGGFSYCIPIP